MKRISISSICAAIALVALLTLGTACETLVSDQQEIALGQQYQQQLSQEQNVYSSPYLSGLGGELARFAPARSSITYQFSMVDNEDLNAFAVPGGHIYVHSGTVKAVDSASELAGVLAHEISHVALLHHREGMGRAMGVDLLNQFVLKDQAEAMQMGVQLLEQGVMQKFNREQEYASDDMAINILYQAGYDPNGLVTFFEKLMSQYGGGNRLFEIMSSHPVTKDRIVRAQQKIAALPPKPNLVKDTPAFQAFKRS